MCPPHKTQEKGPRVLVLILATENNRLLFKSLIPFFVTYGSPEFVFSTVVLFNVFCQISSTIASLVKFLWLSSVHEPSLDSRIVL